jgi:hypothetical protein
MRVLEHMSEAEVSLRVAFHLLDRDLAASDVEVAIDGAQVRTGEVTHFKIAEFLTQNACLPASVSDSVAVQLSSGWCPLLSESAFESRDG